MRKQIALCIGNDDYQYDCLKYGDHIAIVDVSNDDDYPLNSSYLPFELAMTKQTIIKIMKADSKEAVDYVFDNICNKENIREGYLHFLSDEIKRYFIFRKQDY